MFPKEDPKAAGPQDPELESTDGGWDPYVASLLTSGAEQNDAAPTEEDESAPVMSFSTLRGKREKT